MTNLIIETELAGKSERILRGYAAQGSFKEVITGTASWGDPAVLSLVCAARHAGRGDNANSFYRTSR